MSSELNISCIAYRSARVIHVYRAENMLYYSSGVRNLTSTVGIGNKAFLKGITLYVADYRLGKCTLCKLIHYYAK